MFETYRMLGREREADLLREANRLHAGKAFANAKKGGSAERGNLLFFTRGVARAVARSRARATARWLLKPKKLHRQELS